ncbi:hypothetical protein ABZ891_09525 [Streptomyces sp. NPDC047023]|uniref:hypothetical protein n=1 Tax=Streptomyces sp. NPDC047023 TaxID=3155139 RepID=UPI0033FE01FE
MITIGLPAIQVRHPRSGATQTPPAEGTFTGRADEHLLDSRVVATITCAKDLPGPHDGAENTAALSDHAGTSARIRRT